MNHGRPGEGRNRLRVLNAAPQVSRPPSPPVGTLLRTLSCQDADIAFSPATDGYGDAAKIEGSTYVASYNWLDQSAPTVLVPGAPPAWTPLGHQRKFEEDDGVYFRDPNAARFHYPLEPAVRALLAEEDDLDAQKVDLFACSSTVGNLLRFARRVEQRFRFLVQVVGDTVFFIRHENSPTELIEGVRGYGHVFPEASTVWGDDVAGSVSHQRLLKYTFAGLRCLVRSESDGYIPSKVPATPAEAVGPPTGQQEHEQKADDSTHDNPADTAEAQEGRTAKLNVKTGGRCIPQAAVYDLKTRSVYTKKVDVLQEQLPRLWVAQIPNFIIAYHASGKFYPSDTHVRDVREDLARWERDNQKDIKRFAWFLREIIAAARGRGDGKMEVCCQGLGALELRRQAADENEVLPAELKHRWMGDGLSQLSASMDARQSDSDDGSGETESPAAVSVRDEDSDRDLHLSDDESDKDYTACSAEDCGYCGHCSY